MKKKLAGTKWTNSNNVSFEWTMDGRFLHNGKKREWNVLDGNRVQIVFGPNHKDTLVFNDALTEFKQLIKGGPNSFQGARADRPPERPANPTGGVDVAGSRPIALDQFRPEQSRIAKDGSGIRVTFSAADTPGIVAHLPGAANWSAFACLALELQNPGDQAVTFFVRIDDDPKADAARHSGTARTTLGAGESALISIQFPRTEYGKDMHAPPTQPGARPVILIGDESLNLSHVVAARIFLAKPAAPRTLVIKSVRLMPPPPRDGIVDRFGQYTRGDWPGKLKDPKEWAERIKAERDDLKANPPPSDRNRFGGSRTASAPNKSGFFRTAKIDGKWWLVDPDGGLFFSAGVTSMHFGHGTFVADRDKLFTWLPGPDDPLSKHYRDQVHGLVPPVKRRTFDFYGANLQRKYGDDYMNAWRESMLTRLPSWGFNTIGAWPDHGAFYKNGRIPYTATVDMIIGDHARIEGGMFGDKMHDAFDPAFAPNVAKSIKGIAGLSRGDAWCIGYFIENELSVGGWGDDRYRDALAYGALAAPRGSHARAEFVKQLRAKYGQITKLNAAWGTAFVDWKAFDEPMKLTPPGPPARKADCLAFVKSLMRKYYQTVRDEIKKEDPDHLYLGSRFGTWTPEAAIAAAEYCDVVSFNIYAKRLDPAEPWQGTSIFARLDKPCLLGEFGFGALDRGMFHPGVGPAAFDQQHRSELFQEYVRSALDNPAVVGCHWFTLIDQPNTGRSRDGENYNTGLLSVTDTPYQEMISAARKVLGKMNARRMGR